MNARGSTEVIIATIGSSMGAGAHQTLVLTTIVAMAVVATLSMPPSAAPGVGAAPADTATRRPGSSARSSRSAALFRNIERLLVAVDASPSGLFVSHD